MDSLFSVFCQIGGLFPASGREVILGTLGRVNHLWKLKVCHFLQNGGECDFRAKTHCEVNGSLGGTTVSSEKGSERGTLGLLMKLPYSVGGLKDRGQ